MKATMRRSEKLVKGYERAVMLRLVPTELFKSRSAEEQRNVVADMREYLKLTDFSVTDDDTLWRPWSLLKNTTTGRLVDHAPNSFYQDNDHVTVAIYKVPGYGYPVAVWFDNKTGKRIA